MNNLFFESELHFFLDYLSISKEKFIFQRIKMTVLLTVLFLLIVFLLNLTVLALFTPLFSFIGWKAPYFYVVNEKNRQDLIRKNTFPQFLRYFVSLYSTNETVLKTLTAILPFIEEEKFRGELIKLIETIGERTSDSGQAYLAFADFIGTSEARLVMSFLYDFDQMGIKQDELAMLDEIVNNLHENMVTELCERKANHMHKYANPLVLVALFFVFCFVMIVFIYYQVAIFTSV